ncbi:hypothetical protein T484DRAFT_2476133 [Baffinella frigidus]|nr:hypothetical protein T484DRAFT_2476133 [Cryptophyta sp. CCMP2293]
MLREGGASLGKALLPPREREQGGRRYRNDSRARASRCVTRAPSEPAATDQPPHTRSTGPEAAMPKPSSAYPDALPSAHSVQATGSGETTSSGGSFRAPPRAAGQGLRRHATMMSSPGGASEGRHLSESFSSGSRPGFGQSVDGSSSQDDLRSSRLGSHGSAAAAGRGLRRHLTMSPSPGRSPGHPSAKDAAGWQRAKAAMQDHSSLPVGSRMNFGESFGTTALLDARRYNVSTIKTSAPDVSNASPFD